MSTITLIANAMETSANYEGTDPFTGEPISGEPYPGEILNYYWGHLQIAHGGYEIEVQAPIPPSGLDWGVILTPPYTDYGTFTYPKIEETPYS